jgi:predicted metal-dependent phosphotriesterase family hydrolase
LALLIKILSEMNLYNSLLLSTGVKYKTNLIRYSKKFSKLYFRYGGHGYAYISKFADLLREVGLEQQILQKIFKENPLNVLNWWKPIKVKEVHVIFWKCDLYFYF